MPNLNHSTRDGRPEAPTRYLDTRGQDTTLPTFTQVVIQGIAQGGGLYVPEQVPVLSVEKIVALSALPYHARAAATHRALGVDIPNERLDALMALAFGSNFDHPGVAPAVEVASGMHVLELRHGPTSAFSRTWRCSACRYCSRKPSRYGGRQARPSTITSSWWPLPGTRARLRWRICGPRLHQYRRLLPGRRGVGHPAEADDHATWRQRLRVRCTRELR